MRKPLLWSLLLLFLPQFLPAAAQNKYISKRFQWKVAHTDHFDVYYYQGAEFLLPLVTAELDRGYHKTHRILGGTAPARAPFFLFLSHNDFEQNNVVDVGEGTGGVTEAFKKRFLVYNDGSRRWIKHVIVHEFTHVFQFDVLYSGFWRSARLLKSVLYPLWFMEGMAEYCSGDMDLVEEDMVLRDAVTSGQLMPLLALHGFSHVKPHQVTMAYKTGGAALEFIAREYGEEKIGEMLRLLAEKFDMNSVVVEVLGIPLPELDAKFKEYMEEKYGEEAEGLNEPSVYGEPLTRPDGIYPVFNSNPAYFPDGKAFAYLSDKDGFTELYRYDLALERPEPLGIQKRFPGKVENLHRNGSALSISPDGRTVLFAGECRQKDYLYLYDAGRGRLKRIKVALDGASSPQFSPDGEQIVFVGMKDGVNDLYLVRKDGKQLKRLTDTPEDENFPRFFPDGKRIVFSREELPSDINAVPERDLWIRSLEDGKETRLTSMRGDETQPAVSPSGDEVLFIGTEKGSYDLYAVPASGGEPAQLTEIIGGNMNPVFSPDGKKILFASYRACEQHVYTASRESFRALRSVRRGDPPLEVARSSSAVEGPVDLRGGRPYRFRASTDFFFPIFYYSSADGVFSSIYWQASEMLGNHQLQSVVTYASALDFLNYQIYYSYLRFKPRITFGFVGDSQDSVSLSVRDSRREDSQLVSVLYPLNRFDGLGVSFRTTDRRMEYDDDFVSMRPVGRENITGVFFQRDVSQGRFLETTSGYRLGASYDDSSRSLGSSRNYQNVFLSIQDFEPIQEESTFAFQFNSGASFGEHPQFFRTGGSDMMRGYGRYDTASAGRRFMITNAEVRFPIFFDLNYHLWFLFPDFLFKNVYGTVFTDNGLVWNENEIKKYQASDVRNSVGLGIRVETFVLQTFAMVIRFDWAHRTRECDDAFYFGLGPTF